MSNDGWELVLAGALAFNALLGFGYRVYRLTKGGPTSDVLGQGILGVLLIGLAAGAAAGKGWAQAGALVYAGLFGLIVMPVWVLAVLIPLPPKRADYAFTVAYWMTLILLGVAAIAA